MVKNRVDRRRVSLSQIEIAYEEIETFSSYKSSESMLLNTLAKKRTSITKDGLMQKVKAGEISLSNVRETLGHERVNHPKKTNQELLQ